MADMQELIARLEAAEAGNRELDALVWKALNPKGEIAIKGAGRPGLVDWRCRIPGATIANSWTNPGRYTTSLDAALALAERALPEETFWEACHMGIVSGVKQYGFQLYVEDVADEATYGHSSTPALALCIAILRAKQGGGG